MRLNKQDPLQEFPEANYSAKESEHSYELKLSNLREF